MDMEKYNHSYSVHTSQWSVKLQDIKTQNKQAMQNKQMTQNMVTMVTMVTTVTMVTYPHS